jgi:hypothetical protein
MSIFDEDENILLLEDDHDNEMDTSYDLSKSKFVNRIKQVAIECMDHFFCDKTFWAGGVIPKSKLYKEEHIRVVMEMNIMDAFAICYYCLENNASGTVNEKGWDIEICYRALDQCRSRWIPKCYIGGIVLVNLSVCHGIDFLPTLKKLSEIRALVLQREREQEIKLLMKEQRKDDDG